MKKSTLILLGSFTLFALTACVKQQTTLPAENTASVTPLSNVYTVTPDVYQPAPSVVRYDRYLLVDTSPEVAQRYPLEQIIHLKIPGSLKPTVGEAIHYALRQSGYRLCSVSGQSQANTLYQQALPAVQYQLGPIKLSTALQVLAGPAWQLEVDDVQRVVCHSLRSGYQLPVVKIQTHSVTSSDVKSKSISTPLPDSKPVTINNKNEGWLLK
ncbi:PilL N-terminal domain-containing protein [Xenorhabdus khoisanae]|uniref:PFGI-1 class ICE element type IV pilus protein PilL2 n=1 Tax=Xenorhabdus khoisanae TaxID=880157 RepID=UPI002359EBD2|nr:PilL N-terminal domain-containing protein [Xenorhabdus khoisanae]MDC9612931.1 PilL N-terminal domain-containing protein [Xenorhabdus khoisanae]